MKKYIFLPGVVVILAAIIFPVSQVNADTYSSPTTRKWAAQREAAKKRAQLAEQKRLEKERQRKRLLRTLKKTFYIQDGRGGTSNNDAPVRRRRPPASQSPSRRVITVQPGTRGGSGGRYDIPVDECSGLLGQVSSSCGKKPARRKPDRPVVYMGEGPCRTSTKRRGYLVNPTRQVLNCSDYFRRMVKRKCEHLKNSATGRYTQCWKDVRWQVLERVSY